MSDPPALPAPPLVLVLDRNNPTAPIEYPSHLIFTFSEEMATLRGYPSSAIRVVKKLGASQAVVMQGRWVRRVDGSGPGAYKVIREQRPVAMKFRGEAPPPPGAKKGLWDALSTELMNSTDSYDILTNKGLAACKFYGLHKPGETTIEIGQGQETGLRDGDGEVMSVGDTCPGLQYLLLSDSHLDISDVLKTRPLKLYGEYLYSALVSITTLHNNNIRHRDIKPANICAQGIFDPEIDEHECLPGKEIVFIDWADCGRRVFMDRNPKGTSSYLSPQTFLLWVRGSIQNEKENGSGLPDWQTSDLVEWDSKITLATLAKGHAAENDINAVGLSFLRILLDIHGDKDRHKDWPISEQNIETIKASLREGKGSEGLRKECRDIFQGQYNDIYGKVTFWTTQLHLAHVSGFIPILMKLLYIPKALQNSMEGLTSTRMFDDGIWDIPASDTPDLPLDLLLKLIPTLRSKMYKVRSRLAEGEKSAKSSPSAFTASSYGLSTRSRTSKDVSAVSEHDEDAPESERQEVIPPSSQSQSAALEDVEGESGVAAGPAKDVAESEFSWETSFPVVCQSNGNAIVSRKEGGYIREYWATRESPDSNLAVYFVEEGKEKSSTGVLTRYVCGVQGCTHLKAGKPMSSFKKNVLKQHLRGCLGKGTRLTLEQRSSAAGSVKVEEMAVWKGKKMG